MQFTNLIAIEDPEKQAVDDSLSNVQSLGIEIKSSLIWTTPVMHYEVDNTTATQEVTPKIRQEIETMFMTDREEIFEDGMESVFSKAFTSAIRTYGNPIIEILSGLMNDNKVNPEVAAEAMRWLGHIDDPPTYDKRLWLLERSLQNPSARVRDGAALGIASLNDPDAMPYLKKAIEAEECEELREDMKQVLLELEMEH